MSELLRDQFYSLYTQDDNAGDAAEYRLRNETAAGKSALGSVTVPEPLQEALRGISGTGLSARGESMVDAEARRARELSVCASLSVVSGGMVWLHREFTDAKMYADDKQVYFDGEGRDRGRKMRDLQLMLSKELGADRIRRYELQYSDFRRKQKSEAYLQYVSTWRSDVWALLSSSLEKAQAMKKQWDATGFGVGLTGEVLGEILSHYEWAWKLVQSPVGSQMLQEHLLIDAVDLVIQSQRTGEL